MKTIWSILIIVFTAFLLTSGVSVIGNLAGSKGNLDDESINLLSTYDTRLLELSTDVAMNVEQSRTYADFEPDQNDIGDDAKEYFQQKTRVDQLKDAIKMFYKLPDLIIMSIPFVDEVDLGIYRDVIWFFIGAGIFVAILDAIGRRKVTDD